MSLSQINFLLFIFLCAFFLAFMLGVIIVPYIKKKKIKQEILSYVTQHSGKSGTPTMGGIIFIITAITLSLLFAKGNLELLLVSLIFSILLAGIGFFDDYKKISAKQNQGLTSSQKLILQLIIAVAFSVYLYLKDLTFLFIPFFDVSINLRFFIIPIAIFLIVFFTNSVNLTDGLDGLASTITAIVSVVFGAFLLLKSHTPIFETSLFAQNYENFASTLIILSGAILGFIFYNSFPAKIFMGDTGSLFLGAMLCSIGLLSGQIIFLILIGIMYLITCVSVVIQVAYYKLTKKRIFLMAPLHHHFEKKGVHENRIVIAYCLITFVVSAICFLLEFAI